MEAHKRILGILYIISGAFQILAMIFLSALITVLLPVIVEHGNLQEEWVLVWIVPFVRVLCLVIVLFFSIPSIAGGWGILSGQKWAMTLLLILGCFKLFSFPIGTAIGIYTIWVYAQDHHPSTHPA